METVARNAVDDLVRPWTDVLSPRESGTGRYVPIDYPPLLDMLDRAVASSLGRTTSGRSADAERSILNLKAFDLREHIDGTVRAWWKDVSKEKCPTGLKPALLGLVDRLDVAHGSGRLKDFEYTHICGMFPRWRQKIWDLFNPPVVKELLGACPHCETSTHVAADGSSGSALIAYYWKGLEAEAKCQNCGDKWCGSGQLVMLGRMLGATQDEGLLRELGML